MEVQRKILPDHDTDNTLKDVDTTLWLGQLTLSAEDKSLSSWHLRGP